MQVPILVTPSALNYLKEVACMRGLAESAVGFLEIREDLRFRIPQITKLDIYLGNHFSSKRLRQQTYNT